MPLSEKQLIRRVRRMAGRGASVVTGIGDDAAVLRIPAGHEVLVTTDLTIENVHFRREWHAPAVVGWRCLTRGLSDIAAMGGEPRAAFLSLAVGPDVPQEWMDGFLKGMMELARKFKVPLAGGDTAQSDGGIQADIVVVGSAPRGEAVLRSGAKAGESIYVTGDLGGSAWALGQMRQGRPVGAGYYRHFGPRAQVAVGQWLRKHGAASAIIDVSDGLSTDLEHICEESRIGVEIEMEAIPRAPLERGGGVVALEFALHGGDDYELLFSSAKVVPEKIAGVPVTRIGRTTRGSGMRLVDARGKKKVFKAGGWEHFRGQ